MKPKLLMLAKAVLAAALLAFLVRQVDAGQMRAALRAADVGWMASAALLVPFNVALEAAAWRALVAPVLPALRYRTALGAVLCGFALGFATPLRAGELAGRAFFVRHRDKWMLGASVLAQRLLDMLVALSVGLAALVWFLTATPTASPAWWGVGAAGFGTLITLALLFAHPAAVARRVAGRPRLARALRFLPALQGARLRRPLLLCAARYAVYLTQLALLVRAFAPEAGALPLLAGGALTFYAKFLVPSLTLLDLGIREGAAVFFFSRLGVEAAAALNASLVLFGLNLLVPALAGAPFVLGLRPRRRPRARRPAPEALPEATP